MGAPYLFGQDSTFEFYPIAQDEGLTSAQLSAATIVNAYVFTTTNKPTVADSQSGNGAFQGPITVFTGPTNGGWTFTITAISDPNQESPDIREIYWVGINYRLKAGAQIQTAIVPLVLYRPRAMVARIETDEALLESYFPGIDAVLSSQQQTNLIGIAKRLVQSALEAKHFTWASVHRPDKLNDLTAFKALHLGFVSQTTSPGDRWKVLSQTYGNFYSEGLKALALEYDADGDKAPDEQLKVFGSFATVIR